MRTMRRFAPLAIGVSFFAIVPSYLKADILALQNFRIGIGTSMLYYGSKQPPSPPSTTDAIFQVRYAANLDKSDSFINIINTGASGASLFGPGQGAPAGNICVNTYVFDVGEELIACCSCLVTPNQAVSMAVKQDLIENTIHVFTGTSVVVKLLATLADTGGSGTDCSQSAATATMSNVVRGMAAFGTTIHALTPLNLQTTYVTTETPFTPATLGNSELASLTGRCTSILGNDSGFGICAACRNGTLGARKKK
jgi:hypothetical protein